MMNKRESGVLDGGEDSLLNFYKKCVTMKDEDGNTYFEKYWNSPPAPLNEMKMLLATQNSNNRRKAYIAKHPPEKVDLAPSGWDEPMEPKKRRRRK